MNVKQILCEVFPWHHGKFLHIHIHVEFFLREIWILIYRPSHLPSFLEFIIGVIFIFAKPESYKVSLVVQIITLGIYAAMLISHMIANEYTADNIERHELELQYVKNCSAQLKGIMNQVADKNIKKKVEKAYDTLHSSPVRSNKCSQS